MKYDILLTNNGDISFVNSNKTNNHFEFEFHIASSESLSFEFAIENDNIVFEKRFIKDDSSTLSSELNYEFFTYTPAYDKKIKMVKDYKYIDQAIKIRLRTEKGTILSNESLGANMYQFMHCSLDSDKILNSISSHVKNIISDILPYCSVQATLVESNYFDFHDSIKIVIINNEDVYYYYL